MNKKILIILVIIFIILLVFFVMSKPATSQKKISLENGFQVIKMTESAKGYVPNTFTIKKDIPVRWEIEGSTDRTCANALIVPSYKIRAFLKPGKNVVEFTPNKIGTIPFSCSMKMYTGKLYVID